MRHPSATPSPLVALIAAVPIEALRELVLALVLQNGAAAGDDEAPKAAPEAGPSERPPQVHRGWPKGRPRTGPTPPDVLAARRARAAQALRAKRKAARQKKGNGAGKPDGNGSNGALTPAAAVWRKAMTLQPKTPWRIVSRELDVQEALALDCYRRGQLPPNVAPNAIEHFLELQIPAG